MRIFSCLLLVACGGTPIELANQDFGEFETWGAGIEDFGSSSDNPNDTGGNTNTGFSDFDGTYFGTYTFTLSSASGTCSFNAISLGVNVTNGELVGMGQIGTSNCDLGYGPTDYSAKVSFDGNLNADMSALGAFYEDNIFFVEGDWTGFVQDLGTIKQISGTFNQSVEATNPPGTVTVSGSFQVEG